MSQNIPVSNCNCNYCTDSQVAAPATSRYQKHTSYVTSAVLIRLGNSPSKILESRVSPIYEFFSASYRERKNKDYLQASQAAESSIDGQFAVQGSKVKHVRAWSLKSFNFSDYKDRREQLSSILRDAGGDIARKAYGEHRNFVSAVDDYNLTFASVPVNKSAVDYFANRDNVVVMMERDTQKQKNRPYFIHWMRDSSFQSDHFLLPLSFSMSRRFTTKTASEERQDKMYREPERRQIQGDYVLRELLGDKEADLLHPYYEQGNASTEMRFLPISCSKWNCPLCFYLLKLNSPQNYKALYVGG